MNINNHSGEIKKLNISTLISTRAILDENKFSIDELETSIENLIKYNSAKNSSIFIFGRGNIGNSHKSRFDICNPLYRVFRIDCSATVKPDICFDFNNTISRRENLKKIIKDTTPILCIFDWSVFRFVKNIEEFMIDIKNIFPKNCYLIFPYEVYGGGIMLKKYSPYHNDFIESINKISFPYNDDNESYTYFRREIIELSQDLLLATLINIFSKVELHKNCRYPFINIPGTHILFIIHI